MSTWTTARVGPPERGNNSASAVRRDWASESAKLAPNRSEAWAPSPPTGNGTSAAITACGNRWALQPRASGGSHQSTSVRAGSIFIFRNRLMNKRGQRAASPFRSPQAPARPPVGAGRRFPAQTRGGENKMLRGGEGGELQPFHVSTPPVSVTSRTDGRRGGGGGGGAAAISIPAGCLSAAVYTENEVVAKHLRHARLAIAAQPPAAEFTAEALMEALGGREEQPEEPSRAGLTTRVHLGR